jgi:pimeloyl-ACP methyl ester carboxylesterase
MLLQSATIFTAGLTGTATALLTANTTEFDWTTIKPTADLRYHDCFDGFLCARLQVPLDWNNLEDNSTIAIAITTLPASVPVDHPDYGGTIILNPGGLGDAGVKLVRYSGHHLRKVIDNNKKYDYLGFDPRGIGSTTPQVDCFGGDTLARNTNQQMLRGLGAVDFGEEALRRYLALAKGLGAVCENTLSESHILEHVTTAAVCRDMIEMVDRLDELRKKEAALLRHRRGVDKN